MTISESLKKLDGRYVAIGTYRYAERYIESHFTVTISNPIPKADLPNAEYVKFRLHHIGGNNVIFESFYKSKDGEKFYLDLNPEDWEKNGNHYKRLQLTAWEEIPKTESWAIFSIHGEADLTNVGIRSERWTDRWVDVGGENFMPPDFVVRGNKHDPENRPDELWGIFSIQPTDKDD